MVKEFKHLIISTKETKRNYKISYKEVAYLSVIQNKGEKLSVKLNNGQEVTILEYHGENLVRSNDFMRIKDKTVKSRVLKLIHNIFQEVSSFKSKVESINFRCEVLDAKC